MKEAPAFVDIKIGERRTARMHHTLGPQSMELIAKRIGQSIEARQEAEQITTDIASTSEPRAIDVFEAPHSNGKTPTSIAKETQPA